MTQILDRTQSSVFLPLRFPKVVLGPPAEPTAGWERVSTVSSGRYLCGKEGAVTDHPGGPDKARLL